MVQVAVVDIIVISGVWLKKPVVPVQPVMFISPKR